VHSEEINRKIIYCFRLKGLSCGLLLQALAGHEVHTLPFWVCGSSEILVMPKLSSESLVPPWRKSKAASASTTLSAPASASDTKSNIESESKAVVESEVAPASTSKAGYESQAAQAPYYLHFKTAKFPQSLLQLAPELLIACAWYESLSACALFDMDQCENAVTGEDSAEITFTVMKDTPDGYEPFFHQTSFFALHGILMNGFQDTQDSEGRYEMGVYGAREESDANSYLHFTENAGVWVAGSVRGAYKSGERIRCQRRMKSGAKQVLVKSKHTVILDVTLVLRNLAGMRRLGAGAAWNSLKQLLEEDARCENCMSLMHATERWKTVHADLKGDIVKNICRTSLPSGVRHSFEAFSKDRLGSSSSSTGAACKAPSMPRSKAVGNTKAVGNAVKKLTQMLDEEQAMDAQNFAEQFLEISAIHKRPPKKDPSPKHAKIQR
jgi:hypothetical protein